MERSAKRRHLPLQDYWDNCPECQQKTLKLTPCSHWSCHNCGYDTREKTGLIQSLYKIEKDLKVVEKKRDKLNLDRKEKIQSIKTMKKRLKKLEIIDHKV